MTKTMSLREMAEIIANADDRPPEEVVFLHNLFRGWSQREVLQGVRVGSGRTAAKQYGVQEACLARVLSIFREFFGTDGDVLRELIANYRHLNFGPGPEGSQVHYSFARAVEGVAQGEAWTLEVYAVRLRGSGLSGLSIQVTPTKALKRNGYSRDRTAIVCGYLQIDLLTVLRPITDAFSDA